MVTGLLRNDSTTLTGDHYELTEAPLFPKPVQSRLPLMVGGAGEKVTLRITVQYADEWNVWGLPDVIAHKSPVLDQHCADLGRDPSEIQRSAVSLVVMRGDQATRDRIAANPRPTLSGDAGVIQDVIRGYADGGVDEFIVPDCPPGAFVEEKSDSLERFMNDVAAPFH